MIATEAKRTDNGAIENLDVIVVGAGFAGLYLLDRLRRLGMTVRVFEAGGGLGGVWYWNCYPGARVDSPGPIYQYSRDDMWRKWQFSELYPSWQELRDYFRYVDERLGLSRDIRFNRRVNEAQFDPTHNHWIVRSSDGSVASARYLVLCTGVSTKPYIPDLPGLNDFGGLMQRTPLLCGWMSVAMFSSLGLPGLNGFIGEFLIFKGSFAVAASFTAVAALGLLFTAIVFIRAMQALFSGPLAEACSAFADLRLGEKCIVVPVTLLMFALGIAPQFAFNIFNTTVIHMARLFA